MGNAFLPDLGVAFIWCGLTALVAAVVAYLMGLRARREGDEIPLAQRVGRALYFVAAACVLGTAVVHSTLLMTHRFDINYVYRYSARELPPFYLFATFWAGQEGSFLLWAFWTAVLGVILSVTAGKRMEGRVMAVYGVVLGFLLVLLAAKSPFAAYAPLTFLDPQGTPTNGMGLNPLLENPWMVVHPPTLFLGFSSLAVTFAFAISALVWGDFDNWFRRTWPWALFSFAVLGFGIMLGGYWAYETLGWGGFWGWDPVENGPLVPWLAMIAFLHSAQSQRIRGSLKKTTLFLGMAPFVLALYETFLTRTGILDKFSNHSFSTLGGIANSIILYGLLTAVIVSIGLLVWRSRSIKSESSSIENSSSREFSLTVAIALLLACAVITGIGMSAPLITQAGVSLHILQNQSSVQQDYYNKANFPIALLFLLGMVIGPYLAWRQTKPSAFEPLIWTYMAAVVAAIGFVVAGRFLLGTNGSVPMILMLTLSVLCIMANARLLKLSRGGDLASSASSTIRTAGGAIAHIGAAVLLLGVVFLVAWYRQDDEVLVQGHSRQFSSFPLTLTYEGVTSDLKNPSNDLRIDVLEGSANKAQSHYVAYMPVAVRNVEGQLKLLARPAIVHRWWGDIYFALKDGPEQISPTALIRGKVQEGGTTTLAGYKLTAGNFSADPVAAAQARAGKMPSKFPVTVPITVTSPSGATQEVDAQFITFRDDPLGETSPEMKLPMGKDRITWSIAISSINADQGVAQIYIRDAGVAPLTAYTVEVSTRPMISLVWIGTILIALGGLMSMRRRLLENRLVGVPDPVPLMSGNAPGKRDTISGRSSRRHRTTPIPAKGGH